MKARETTSGLPDGARTAEPEPFGWSAELRFGAILLPAKPARPVDGSEPTGWWLVFWHNNPLARLINTPNRSSALHPNRMVAESASSDFAGVDLRTRRSALHPTLRPSRLCGLILCVLVGTFARTARGELQIVPASEPARVFAGTARSFTVVWRNPGDNAVTANVRMRLLQTTSATTTTVGEWPWKKLQVLEGQTITERAMLDFPEVKAETRFLVQWLAVGCGTGLQPVHEGDTTKKDPASPSGAEQTGRMPVPLLGTTEVLVYPTNLLAELKPLAGEDQPVGVFDPGNVLKPLLKAVGVEFEDLEDSGVASFRGKLAIIGPFTSREQMPGDLAERIEKLARKSTGVVWLQPSPAPREKLQPSFRTVALGDGAVVVVQSQLVANLADNPPAQLNLLHFCRLAREPEPPRLPNLNPQP